MDALHYVFANDDSYQPMLDKFGLNKKFNIMYKGELLKCDRFVESLFLLSVAFRRVECEYQTQKQLKLEEGQGKVLAISRHDLSC